MAGERQDEPTERGQLWREAILLQPGSLPRGLLFSVPASTAKERLDRAMVRPEELDVP